jgi:endonuclease YncB( thermonuclease family)
MCALALAAHAGPAWPQDQQPVASCNFHAIGPATVQDIKDARTVTLTDHREVRLAGIETPAAEPTTELAALLVERAVVLKRLGAGQDRYGRISAYVFVGSDQRSIQETLLAKGRALVAAQVGDADCASELHRAEALARAAHLGVWSDPTVLVRSADDPAGVLTQRGRFALVEGQVLSVRESGATIYVNFGRRWSEDFTVTVPKRLEKTFTKAGLELKKLSGRRVRVRGTVEERGGPWIEAVRPEQIEIADRN